MTAQPSPRILRFAASSLPPAAKSSKAFSVTRMMWCRTNSAPSRAPSSGMLQRALPLHHRPAVEVVGGELGEDRAEVHLPVAGGAEAPGPVHPAGVAGIDPLPPGRIELRVLDVEHADPLVVDVDVVEIVEALQHVVRRVVEHVAAHVPVELVEEHLEGRAVEQVLARMDLVADVDPVLLGEVEDRPPAPRQLLEGRLDQPRRPLRPGIGIGPGQRAGEGRHRRQPHALRRLQRHAHLLHRPLLPRLRVAAHLRRREAVEERVIGRMHRHQLPLQVRRELGHLDAVGLGHALDLVAIVLRGRRLLQVEELPGPGRHLHADIAAVGRPPGDPVPGVEGRRVAGELSEEQRRALDASS